MRALLNIFAWLCKIGAILVWLYMATAKIELDIANLHGNAGSWGDPDWGTPVFKYRVYLDIAQMTVLAVLAFLPNRWLAFSPLAFVISLLIALIPLYWILSSLTAWSDLLWLTPLMFLSALLPLSLILSFWRQRKGEKVAYA